jgi:hypothetical protein
MDSSRPADRNLGGKPISSSIRQPKPEENFGVRNHGLMQARDFWGCLKGVKKWLALLDIYTNAINRDKVAAQNHVMEAMMKPGPSTEDVRALP